MAHNGSHFYRSPTVTVLWSHGAHPDGHVCDSRSVHTGLVMSSLGPMIFSTHHSRDAKIEVKSTKIFVVSKQI